MSQAENWKLFNLDELIGHLPQGSLSMQEFLRTPSMSCTIYHVPAGSRDMASAHEEDELYLVLAGRGRLRVNDSEHQVSAGTMMYVQAASDHTFFDVEEDITALAFFGVPRHRAKSR